MLAPRIVGIGFLTAFLSVAQVAHAIVVPVNDGFVTDAVGILNSEEESALEQTLTSYHAATSNEIAILVIRSSTGAAIADVAVEIGRKWGVGGAENNNGILILVSYEDREVFIATGYGLEGAVPDLVAKGIVEEDIAPAFRDGEYAAGLTAAVTSLQKHIGGEYTAERYEDDEGGAGAFGWVIFALFVAFDALGAFFARSKSWWLGGIVGAVCGIVLVVLFSWWVSIPVLVILGLAFDFIVSKTNFVKNITRGKTGMGGWGGGRRGGGGGGGFGGFGGGSFGGGGAGGKW